jgi:D-alanyl-D-alanine carboxypeptidase
MGSVVSDLLLSRIRLRLVGRAGRAWLLALAVSLLLIQPAAANPRYAALVIDAKTGETLFERYADEPRFPASLTKMMTLYLVFEELEAGRLTLDTSLKVSAYAAGRPPTKLGLPAGATIRVEDAIKALAVRSANDISVVIAEHIGGSVSAFAARMTRTARAIGMRNTTFRNPNGLPNSEQITTARDMALLAQALKDRFPRYYSFFNTRSFSYNGRRYTNTNRLLGNVRGMDGIKTGYTRASGFNLVSHVERDGRSIIAVVMGGRSAQTRNNHMVEIVNAHLPKATRGPRTAPLVSVNLITPAPTPRSRPGLAQDAASAVAELVGAPEKPAPEPAARQPQPVATAAPVLAYTIMPLPRPMPAGFEFGEAREDDPIAARIASANEVAELAYAAQALSDGDTLAKLAEMASAAPRQTPPVALAKADQEMLPARQQDGAADPAEQEDAPAAAEPADEPLPSGWQIQIAAVPDEAGARALLQRARERAAKALGDAKPYTQQVESKGTVFYRARFAGFGGKEEARGVCAKLKRQSIDCLALPN